MKIFFLIDISGSMQGAKIQALNDSMENIMSELRSHVGAEQDEISVLLFSRNARWTNPVALPINQYSWTRVEASGMTSLGKACILLEDRLISDKGNKKRIIILISDGCPTDDFDEGFNELEINHHFQNTIRFSIAIGQDASIDILTKFAGEKERVHSINSMDSFLDILSNILASQRSESKIQNCTSKQTDEDDEWA